MSIPIFALLLAALPTAVPVPHGDELPSWPQWRGPDQNDVSRESAWVSEGKSESLWESNVGLGYSSVTVADGRLFTMGYDAEGGVDVIWCLDPETGEELWAHPYEAAIWNQAHTGGTLNTPTIDGEHVYTLNREGNMFAFDAGSGDILWHHHLKNEHDLTYPTWGFSAAPLVLGDELIVNVGKVMRLDKKTGEPVWASKDYGHAYGTPTAFQLDGKPALAVLNGDGLAVLDRTNGKELYFYAWSGTRGVNAASPIVVDNEAIFISSTRKGAGALLAFGPEGLEPVWESRTLTTQLSGCVLMDGHFYGFDGGVLKCVNVYGDERWSVRGIGNGAVSAAPGRLLAMSSKGELIVAEASPEEYRELSKTKLIETGSFWTKPVLAGGLIYCRGSLGELICRDHRATDAKATEAAPTAK